MMLGLGVGGVAVGMFHLITHAFFKALLFLGAGSVIHGCTEEQDIRNMGGLRRFMPVTFLTYAAGMLALCGFPLFAGFWSKDAILARGARLGCFTRTVLSWAPIGALLTAFYMTRQVYYVFFGPAPHAHRCSCAGPNAPAHAFPAEEIEPVVSAGRGRSVHVRGSAREPARDDLAADPARHLRNVPRISSERPHGRGSRPSSTGSPRLSTSDTSPNPACCR